MYAAGVLGGGGDRPRSRLRPPSARLAPALLALALAGCGSSPRRPVDPERDLLDPRGGVRTRAVVEVARTRDTARVPELIELLDDEDPGVRMVAGSTLTDLTGHDTGYSPWAPPETLRAQVLAWRAWWAAREGSPEPAP